MLDVFKLADSDVGITDPCTLHNLEFNNLTFICISEGIPAIFRGGMYFSLAGGGMGNFETGDSPKLEVII